MENSRLVITILGGFIGLMLFLSAVSWFMAMTQLAEKYPARRPQKRACWRVRGVRLGSGLLTVSVGTLKVCADSEGIHISTGFPASMGVAPFSVPWHEITGQKKTRWLDYGVKLHFQRAPDIHMHISILLARRLVKASGGAWEYEEG